MTPPKQFVIKTWELKCPFIKNSFEIFDDVVQVSKMFIRRVIQYCLTGWTTSADLIDFASDSIFRFDFESFLYDYGTISGTMFYNVKPMNGTLAFEMAPSTYCNLQHPDQVKQIDSETVANITSQKIDSLRPNYISEVDQDLICDNDDDDWVPVDLKKYAEISSEITSSPKDPQHEAGFEYYNNSSSVEKLTPSLKLPSIINEDMYYRTCYEIQESQEEHTNMVLAVSYQTSRVYLNYQFNRELHIDNEDAVVIKILDLSNIRIWFKTPRYYDDAKREKFKRLKADINNEIFIYKRIWRHNNNSLEKTDSDNFINVPRLIHYGETSSDPPEWLDVISGNPQIDKDLESVGGLKIRSLLGTYLVLEYLKGMRAPRGEKEFAKVEKELAKLQKIGVTY
ncbi:unnamed protein product [Ambrosiozyma monospora]|uniref:Unnamed protein product n=1 Tax=Ambrosiozyma monospora TaxID=43982 RepID=A0ACB5SWG3_AMBMO|nr:unnamed protein product [Ambrosiozyma monospora]